MNIHNQNKESLTIVYGDYSLVTKNFDSNNPFLLGCQFINMNFHIYDDHLIKYMKRFQNKYGNFSIILKPSNLRRFIINKNKPNMITTRNLDFNSTNKMNSINKLYDTYKNIKITPKEHVVVDKGCCLPISKVTNSICSNLTSQNECDNTEGCKYSNKLDECKIVSVGLVFKDNNFILSPVTTSVNSTFKLIAGINKQINSISIKYQDKFLVSSVNNLVTFKSHEEAFSSKNNASFLPETICSEYVSFSQVKNNKKLYLKYSDKFNYKNNLYTKRCTNFEILSRKNNGNTEVISLINENNETLTIYKPKVFSNYKSIGDIFIKGEHNNTILSALNIDLYMGDTQSPIGFDPVWDDTNIYIWKPKAPPGFIGLGCVSTITSEPPSVEDYCCIGEKFLDENNLDSNEIWKNDNVNPNGVKKLSIWGVGNYYICSTNFKKPSKFVRPVYIIRENKQINEGLYLEEITDPKKINNACFGISSVVDKYISNIDVSNFSTEKYKYTNQISFIDKTRKCIGVPNIYWGNIDSEYRLKALECNDSYPGTNFIMYTSSQSESKGMIRFKDDIKNCIEMFNKDGQTILKMNKCNNSPNQQFLYKDNILSLYKSDLTSVSPSLYYNPDDNSLIMSSDKDKQKSYKSITVSLSPKIIIQKCIHINDKVYMKQHIERKYNFDINDIQEDNTILENILNEEINRIYIEAYVIYIVSAITETNYSLIQISNNNKIEVPIQTTELYMDFPMRKEDLLIGNEVLFEHGGIIGHKESTVKWKGVINSIDTDTSNVDIISSINSYEPNNNNLSLGRPRVRKIITKSQKDIVMLVPTVFCDFFNIT